MKIVVSHALYRDGMDALQGHGDIVVPGNGDSDVIIDQLRDADAYILRIGKIDRKAIEQCPNLKVITRPGVGYDSVDVAAATEHGIPVVLCMSANARAVAEHTLAMLFALSKNLVESVNETKADNYNIRNKFAAVELFGKTVSIIGFGNIGKQVAAMCCGMGMSVAAYDPFVSQEVVEALGCTYCATLEEALALGDFITLHMPSMPETRNLISAPQLRMMKPSAFLLNAARGDIIDEPALCAALDAGALAGAGMDVLVCDPPERENPLFGHPNVIITPHMAAQTKETASKLALLAVEGTLAVLAGEKWAHVANPDVYNHPRWADK